MSQPVDYDRIAADYESRYRRSDYTGIKHELVALVGNAPDVDQRRVLEVGCGTGYWLRFLRDMGLNLIGIDPSQGMLKVAQTRRPDDRLVRARAEALPCRRESFDFVFCVNALHHFTDAAAFFYEARRVLRHGGALLTIGLDPHAGRDRWWIYEYFPTALLEDRRRYLPAGTIRELMEASGFSQCETREVQHIPARLTVSEAAGGGFLDRTSTSQLMVISQSEYETGLQRIHSDNINAGGTNVLRTDLRVYGTTGWAP